VCACGRGRVYMRACVRTHDGADGRACVQPSVAVLRSWFEVMRQRRCRWIHRATSWSSRKKPTIHDKNRLDLSSRGGADTRDSAEVAEQTGNAQPFDGGGGQKHTPHACTLIGAFTDKLWPRSTDRLRRPPCARPPTARTLSNVGAQCIAPAHALAAASPHGHERDRARIAQRGARPRLAPRARERASARSRTLYTNERPAL
jgi:hypothetical protein